MEPTPMNIEAPSTKASMFEKIAIIMLSGLLGLIPLVVVPQTVIGFSYVKMGLATLAVFGAFILFLAKLISEGSLKIYSLKALLSLVALPVVATLAAFSSPHVAGGLMGMGYEFDTAYFLLLGVLLVALCAHLFSTKQRIFGAYLTFFVSFIVIALVHLLKFAAGVNVLGLQTLLPTMASNTVGAWNDFGTYAGLAAILSFITLEFVSLDKLFKWILSAVLGLSLILLGIANFYTIFNPNSVSIPGTAIVGLVALFVFVYTVSSNYKLARKNSDTGTPRYKLPIPSSIVLACMVVFTIAAQPIAGYVYQKIGISSAEVVDVRPTLGTTFQIAGKVIAVHPLDAALGVGPNRFYSAWSMYKPQSVNQTVFWNTDFNYASGYIPTFLTTTGILGFLAWLFFLGLLIYYGWKGAFAGLKDKFSQYLIVSSLLASAYLWFIAFFTISGPVIVLLAFFFTGLLYASLIREEIVTSRTLSWISHQKKGFVAVFIALLLIIGSLALAFTWTRHFVAAVHVTSALQAVAANDISKAETEMAAALQKDMSDSYLRTFAQVRLYQLRQQFETAKKAELTKDNAGYLNDALLAAREAALVVNPTNYQNWLLLGSIYESAGLLGVDGAGALAKQSYEQVRVLNPTSPLPDLLIARLYAYAQDPQNAKAQIEQALQKKTDFNEAYSLLQQIQSLKSGTPAPVKTEVSTSTATSTAATSSAPTKSAKKK